MDCSKGLLHPTPSSPCRMCEVPHHLVPGSRGGEGGIGGCVAHRKWRGPWATSSSGSEVLGGNRANKRMTDFEPGSRSKPRLLSFLPTGVCTRSACNGLPSSRDRLLFTDHPNPSKGAHQGTGERKGGDSPGRCTVPRGQEHAPSSQASSEGCGQGLESEGGAAWVAA